MNKVLASGSGNTIPASVTHLELLEALAPLLDLLGVEPMHIFADGGIEFRDDCVLLRVVGDRTKSGEVGIELPVQQHPDADRGAVWSAVLRVGIDRAGP